MAECDAALRQCAKDNYQTKGGKLKDMNLSLDTTDISAIEPVMSSRSGSSSVRSLGKDTQFIEGISRSDGQGYDISKIIERGQEDSLMSDKSVDKARIEASGAGRDDEEKKPTVVLVSFKINNVSDIDVFKGTFVVNISIFYHWEDPALIGKPLGHVSEKDLSVNPDMIVINDLDLVETKEHYSLELLNTYTGAVKQSRHYKGRAFLLSLDLLMFPFDCHNLSLNLRSKKQDFNNVVLEYFSEESTVDAHPQHEWLFHGYTALTFETLPKYSTTGKCYSSLHVVVQVQRNSGWFVNNAIIPFFCLTAVSWASYSLPESIAGLYDLSVLTLVASILVKISTSVRLAQVPYRTMADWYIDVSMVCQLFSVLSVVLKDWIADLNMALLYANVGIYALFHTWFFVHLYYHSIDVSDWKERVRALNATNDLNINNDDFAAMGKGGVSEKVREESGGGLIAVNDASLNNYMKLGWTTKKQVSRLARFGLEQDVIMDFDEEEEEHYITVNGGADGERGEEDGSNPSSPGNASNAATRQSKRRQKLARDYAENLKRIHQYQETRPELAHRLKKWGLTADYAKPQLEKMLAAGTFKRESLPRKVSDWSTGAGGTMPYATRRAETSANILVGGSLNISGKRGSI